MNRLILLSIILLNITLGYAQEELSVHNPEILRQSKIYLYTAPAWCIPCRSLESELAQSGNVNSIDIRVNGIRYSVEIERIIPGETALSQEEINALGLEGAPTPAFSLVTSSGEALISAQNAYAAPMFGNASGNTIPRKIRQYFRTHTASIVDPNSSGTISILDSDSLNKDNFDESQVDSRSHCAVRDV